MNKITQWRLVSERWCEIQGLGPDSDGRRAEQNRAKIASLLCAPWSINIVNKSQQLQRLFFLCPEVYLHFNPSQLRNPSIDPLVISASAACGDSDDHELIIHQQRNGPDVVVRDAPPHAFAGANYTLKFLSVLCTFTSTLRLSIYLLYSADVSAVLSGTTHYGISTMS